MEDCSTPTTVINVYTKNVYGNPKMYVAGSAAKAIETLTTKKTVDSHDLIALQQLGFQVNIFDSEALAMLADMSA